jgi:CTP synthase
MFDLADESRADVIVVEVGGTVGDIEGQPFLEAIRQMRNDAGRDNVFYVHVTYLPHIPTTGELKTKPTQHSVRELRSDGIQPDAIVCRSEEPVTDEIKDKISLFCDVTRKSVIAAQTASSVYEVPLLLEEEGLGDTIVDLLRLPAAQRDMADWRELVEAILEPKRKITIAMVGKYVDLQDSYISVKEALFHAGLMHGSDIEIEWVSAEEVEEVGPDRFLGSVSGIVVPGGFGPRGVEGMIETVRYARDYRVPYLGLCLGMQVMVIEIARSLLSKDGANSTEFDPNTIDPVIDLMPDQRQVTEMGGTMRLGVYPCKVVPGTWAERAYGNTVTQERHRHRFEVNNVYREAFDSVGFWSTGLSPDDRLVEIMEYEDHPFMVGVQFHPEFLSRPNRPHPLFREFIGVARTTLREGGQHILPLEQSDLLSRV